MSHSEPVLVIGGTRGTGLLIAQRLSVAGLPVRVLARDPNRAATRLGANVQVVPGDLTRGETLPAVIDGVRHIIFTAGVRSGRPTTRATVQATEYGGVLNTLAAARSTNFAGRFLYMTSSGATGRSVYTILLNLYKGNTLLWRARAESAIRNSGLDYTIIRTGLLVNRGGGQHTLRVSQDALPLTPRLRIARSDVADAFVAALDHPRASRATFEIVWTEGSRPNAWPQLLADLRSDDELRRASGGLRA